MTNPYGQASELKHGNGGVDAPMFRFRWNRRRRKRRREWEWGIAAIVCLCVLFFCSFSLIRYMMDKGRSLSETEELQKLYYGTEEDPEESGPKVPFTEYTVVFKGFEQESEQKNVSETEVRNWPDNPERRISAAFQKLRKRNRDIVGWLTIPGLLDQAVVQRDNSYYLKRDYLGYHNVNGALFLEKHISLMSRPQHYIIFGHNMKTGEMFGGLRNYEDPAYYRNNPVIDFNVLYEEGEYVIFAIADVDILSDLPHYIPFMQMEELSSEEQNACIRKLQRYSKLEIPLLVDAEDQLLLLVTCEGTDRARRVVAARRLRDGETPEGIAHSVRHTIRRE